MNDKIIIKIITKIHLRLLTFFAFLFLLTLFCFVVLIEGFTISHLKLGDIILEKVYLKWDNRLHIRASLIDLSALKSDNEPITLKPLQHFPQAIKYAQQWIASIDVQTLRYKKTSLSLHYLKNSQGKVSVHKGNIHLYGQFVLTPMSLTLDLIAPKNSTIQIKEHLSLDIVKQKFILISLLKLPHTPAITGYAMGDQKKLYLKITADKPFSRIDEVVDFIGLDPIIRPWVVQYAVFKTATLQKCEGNFLYDHPDELLKSLNIHATAREGEYTFAKTIAPIKAKNIDVYFQKGKLHILPHEGTFYTLPTEKSRLFIDFTTPNAMLNAHILTAHGQLNDDILALLRYYKIKVPIRQNRGISHVDLHLEVNLHTLNTTANGQFIPAPSEIQLEDFLFNTTGGIVTLKDSKVEFYGFDVEYDSNTKAKLKGNFDATKELGDVHIVPYFCAPTGNSNDITLLNTSSIPHVIYHIDPHQDTISLTQSTWNFYGETLHLESFLLPFNFKERHFQIPKLKFNIDKKAYGTITGEISSKDWQLDLHLDELNIHSLQLQKKPLLLHIAPKESMLTFSTDTLSFWKLGNQPIVLSPFSLSSNNSSLIFNNIKMEIEDQIKTTLSGKYLWGNRQGSLVLKEMSAINPKIANYIDMKRNQTLSIDTSQEEPVFHSQSLGVDLSPVPQGWKMEIGDIALLSNNSPLLTRYGLNHGNITLTYSPSDERITFNGLIEYPYHFMMVNGKSLSTYRFSGSYLNGKTLIRVNDRLNITRDGSIAVRANNMGINSHELLRWLSSFQKNSEGNHLTADTLPIRVNATNVYLYLMENRRILADNLHATLSEGDLDARLTYGQGSADVTMKEGLFYAQGAHFGARFMENLFAFSDFQGGDLSFTVKGKPDQFEGIIRIENTILKEYIVLNNLLSFINTIPSLTTFSLPNYNTKGLFVYDTYGHFTYQNHLFDMDTYTLNSPELKIGGSARINMVNDSIEGSLTLKTDLGSMLGKVPMVGYILLGDDGSISTTVNLKGKLSDPIVETAIAKEIVSAPFNILKRTITYPFLWMMPDEKKK